MNFKGIILTVVSFLLVAVSCSVEDDAYMNNNNNVENATVVSDQEAYLSFNVDAQAATKSISEVSPSDTLNAVTSCSVVLFSNNNILAVMDDVTVKNGKLQNCSFLTKVRNDLKVAIIANTTQSFENCPTMKEVRETIQSANDLKSLVKYGEAAVSFNGETGSASTKDGVPTVPVTVTLHQLAAIVELASFNTTFEADAKVEEVVITKVELKNANVNTFTNQNGYSKFETLTKTMGMNVNNFSKVDFRTYESNDVTLSITFKVGEREYEKNYKINGGSVNSGYIYRLNVNMTLKTHDVDMNVELSVADWTNNSISMDMTEE